MRQDARAQRRVSRIRPVGVRGDDAAVSDVLGSLLLVGITVLMAVGFGFLLISFDGPPNLQHTRVAVAMYAGAGDWGTGDEQLVVRHAGGEPIERDQATITVVAAGGTTRFSGIALDDGFSDGSLTIGESWIHVLTAQVDDAFDVHVVADGGDVSQLVATTTVVAGSTGGSASLVATYTYVASAIATTGTVGTLANAMAPAADGTEAQLLEAGTAVPGGTVGPTRFAAATVAHNGAVSEANAAVDDGLYTTLNSANDYVQLSGFDLPSNAVTATAVTIGFQGSKEANGNTVPQYRIDYVIAGTPTLGTAQTDLSTSDAEKSRPIGALTVAQVEGMAVRIFAVVVDGGGTRDILVDHIFIEVTYTTAASTQYSMDIRLDFTSVPAATTDQDIELLYRVTGDTFNVFVWDFTPGSWRQCTGTLTATTPLTTFTCDLNADEYSSGQVRVRVTDVTPTGTTQGSVFIDHARVATL